MKIVFTGGGTLGHIYPALSIYDYIKERDETLEAIWIGTKRPIDRISVEKKGILFYPISSGKLRRYFSIKNFIDVFKVIIGYFQAKKILKKTKPDLVFSKGGYVSVVVVYAAKRLNIKVVTHESDISLGLATRLNSKVASKIFKGFPLSEKEREDKRFIYSGNPIRDNLTFFKNIDIIEYRKQIESGKKLQYSEDVKKVIKEINEKFNFKKKTLLVVGGSLGALEINNLIEQHLDQLLKDFNIYHQMGDKTFKKVDKKGYICVKTIGNELGYLYRISDLVISRCGANTLNEEIFFQKNILAIPLKNSSSRGEQVLNANYYKDMKLLEVLEKEMNFIDTIKKLLNNEIIKERSEEYRKLDIVEANEIIYNTIKEIN